MSANSKTNLFFFEWKSWEKWTHIADHVLTKKKFIESHSKNLPNPEEFLPNIQKLKGLKNFSLGLGKILPAISL